MPLIKGRETAKTLKWFNPLLLGRFGIANAGFSPWMNGLCLTMGRFWVRNIGGHNLRRLPGPNIPELTDEIAGCADGPVASITTGPHVGHPASGRYTYRLTSVGSGGVESDDLSNVREVVVTAAGALANPVPRPILGLAVKPADDGSFLLRWSYEPRRQAVAPAHFAIFSNGGSGEIDYSSPLATVNYSAGATEYQYDTGVIAGSTWETWQFAIRARVTSARFEASTAAPPAVPATDTPQYDVPTTHAVVEVESAPAPPRGD